MNISSVFAFFKSSMHFLRVVYILLRASSHLLLYRKPDYHNNVTNKVVFLIWKHNIFLNVSCLNHIFPFNTKVACTRGCKLVVLYTAIITVIIITIINESIIHLPFGTPWPIHRMLEKTYLGGNVPNEYAGTSGYVFSKRYPRQIITRM